MPRVARRSRGGLIYHVLNRANAGRRLFRSAGDYAAFLAAMIEALERYPGVRLLAFCIMPNHFHLVLWPARDGELSAFMHYFSQIHAQRWRRAHESVGHGSLYQGRYKSFIVEEDHHFLVLCRYIERNALRARLCRRAQDWRWCSASARSREGKDHPLRDYLSDWPIDRPSNWLALLNTPQDERDEARVRTSIERSRPFGGDAWVKRTAKKLGLTHTLRPPGRPPGAPDKKPRKRRWYRRPEDETFPRSRSRR